MSRWPQAPGHFVRVGTIALPDSLDYEGRGVPNLRRPIRSRGRAGSTRRAGGSGVEAQRVAQPPTGGWESEREPFQARNWLLGCCADRQGEGRLDALHDRGWSVHLRAGGRGIARRARDSSRGLAARAQFFAPVPPPEGHPVLLSNSQMNPTYVKAIVSGPLQTNDAGSDRLNGRDGSIPGYPANEMGTLQPRKGGYALPAALSLRRACRALAR